MRQPRLVAYLAMACGLLGGCNADSVRNVDQAFVDPDRRAGDGPTNGDGTNPGDFLAPGELGPGDDASGGRGDEGDRSPGDLDAPPLPSRLSTNGRDILLPDGTPFMPFGVSEGHWGSAEVGDAAYLKNTIGANFIRVEFHLWGLYPLDPSGHPIDARDDTQTATAGIATHSVTMLDQYVEWYTSQGLWVDIAVHSKCGRSGLDSADPSLAQYCDPESAYPSGHNFWTDPEMKTKWLGWCTFIANRYKSHDLMGFYEPLNEPDPTGISDLMVSQYYQDAMAAMLAVDPRAVFIIGGSGGYSPNKIGAAYIPNRANVVYTFDWFNYANASDPRQSLSDRLTNPLELRAQSSVPILPEQFGARIGDDPDRSIFHFQLQTLVANEIPAFQWEIRAPGPGASTYGWIMKNPNGDGTDIIRAADESYMIEAGAGFAALEGESLN